MLPVDISVPSPAPAFAGTKDCKVERSALKYSFACFLTCPELVEWKGLIDEIRCGRFIVGV